MEFSREDSADKTRNVAVVSLAEQDGGNDFRAQLCVHHYNSSPTVIEIRCCKTNMERTRKAGKLQQIDCIGLIAVHQKKTKKKLVGPRHNVIFAIVKNVTTIHNEDSG